MRRTRKVQLGLSLSECNSSGTPRHRSNGIRHRFQTTATLHTLMKLCTALGWKVCRVSLHYNLDALEVTHRTHSRSKKQKKQKQSLEEMQAEQTASIVGRLFRKPLVPSFPSKPCRIDMQTFVMSQCGCNGCTPQAPLLYGWKRERVCVCVLRKHVNAAAVWCDVRETTTTLKHWNDSKPCVTA